VSPITHFFTGWVLGSVVGSNKRERAVITLAAVVPDLDGLGIIPEFFTRNSRHPLLWFSQYHHDLHILLFAIVVSFFAFFLAGRRWRPAIFAFIGFHLHLVEDLVGLMDSDGQFRTCFPSALDGLGAGVVNGH
jgi:inner membrane protein